MTKNPLKNFFTFAKCQNKFSRDKPSNCLRKSYPKVQKLMIAGITYGENLCMHPFGWNPDSGKLRYVTEKRNLVFWYFNIGVTIVFLSLSVFRTIQEISGWRVYSAGESFLIRFALVILFGLVGIHANTYAYGADVPYFINNSIRFFEKFAETTSVNILSGDNRASIVKLTELLMMMIYYGIGTLALPFVLLAVVRPTLPVLLSSLVEDPTDVRNWPLFALSIFIMCVTLMNYITCVNFYLMVGVAIVIPSLDALDKLRTLDGVPVKTKLKLFSDLVLIFQTYNRIHGPLLLPLAEGVLVSLSVYGIVSLITSEGVIRLALVSVGIVAYGILVVVFRMLAEILHRSELLLLDWKDKDAVDPRILKHLRPLSIAIGTYFFVDIGLILTLTDLIVNNAAGILLAQDVD